MPVKYSAAEENYVKSIYHLQVNDEEGVSASMLAQAVNTSAASVTDMLKKLHVKKIINYKPYKNFSLTESGHKLAIDIVRKHRLWEYFLVDKLGFEWDEVHEIAEELEHISSKELILRLEQFLGNPTLDPHGDPIPDRHGKIRPVRQYKLDDLELKQLATVSSIKDQRPEMLEILDHYGIGIGTKIRVTRRFTADGSSEIRIEKKNATLISAQVAATIFCTI